MRNLSAIMEQSASVEPMECSRAVVASLAQGLEAMAAWLGPQARLVGLGNLDDTTPGDSDGGPGPAVRLLAGPGVAITLLAQPDSEPPTNGEPRYRVALTLSASAFQATVQHLLDDAHAPLTQEEAASLGELAALGPFSDTDVTLAARLLSDSHRAAVEEMEAARERERARIEGQAKLAQIQRNRAYLGLAEGLGHHHNNRLAVIMARAGLLSHMRDDPIVIRCAREIEQASLRCTDFIERFSSYASRTLSSPVAARGVLDDVVRQALVSVQRLIEASNGTGAITVATNLECSSTVVVPRDDLQSGIEAIITNAIEAMPMGGALTIRTRQEDAWAFLDIEDTGIGMPHSVASKVFNPFFTTKGPERAGLSLAHIHASVLQHGGSIDVETAEGRGTIFHLRLPRSERHPEDLTGSERRAGDGPIVVVEDEDDVRRALCDLLQVMGFEVVGARDGDEAEEEARRRELGLVLTDGGVPGLSAFELTRRLRALGVEAPVVLLTGWVRDVDPAAAREVGIDLILAKPISAEDLAGSLRSFGVRER